MEWLSEFGQWFVVVALVLGGPTIYRHFLSHGSAVRRKLNRSERRVRQLREVTERFERLQVEQRSVEARQAALDRNDLERLAMLQQACIHLGGLAEVERRAPGTTGVERDLDALLDAAASLGDEYTRSASLGHILEVCVQAGLYEQARSHARWVTDASVRDRLFQNPNLAPLLRPDGPVPLLLWPPVREPVPVDPRPPARDAAD